MQELARQRESGRSSRTAAAQRARASDKVRSFDQNVRSLREKIRRLATEIERTRSSNEVAVTGGIERTIGLVGQRGAA